MLEHDIYQFCPVKTASDFVINVLYVWNSNRGSFEVAVYRSCTERTKIEMVHVLDVLYTPWPAAMQTLLQLDSRSTSAIQTLLQLDSRSTSAIQTLLQLDSRSTSAIKTLLQLDSRSTLANCLFKLSAQIIRFARYSGGTGVTICLVAASTRTDTQ